MDVLPREEYEEAHLPGAINIPLKELNGEATARLGRDAPVIVYCHDYLWDMSSRAAWRLEGMCFSRVYDYAPGKADWSASGLPTEGTRAGTPTIGEAARRTDLRPGGEGRRGARAFGSVELRQMRGREQSGVRARAAEGEGAGDRT